MPRRPEIGNVQLYPNRPLRSSEKNGYVLKFYCPLLRKRIRKNCGTRDRTEARRILRECRQRLLDGKYIESGGIITEALKIVVTTPTHRASTTSPDSHGRTWEACFEHYYAYRRTRDRDSSINHVVSRLGIAKRILDGYCEDRGLPADAPIERLMTLEALEFVQDRLLAGDDCRYDNRSPMTVNTTLATVMAFVRHCHRHGWIERVPHLIKLDVDDVMKGRPITEDEFQRLVDVTPEVVGKAVGDSWIRVLNILWESAFRVGDLMIFSWDDERRIHPVWPTRANEHPLLAVPSTQKNKKSQQIPMLPGLRRLLEETPNIQRHGWVANPLLPESRPGAAPGSFRPTGGDLAKLIRKYSNSAIARACGVSETAVRKWLADLQLAGLADISLARELKPSEIAKLRQHSETTPRTNNDGAPRRLSKEIVGRIIARIGERAKVIVQQPDEETGKRIKYASAHDLRRGCAQRLINAGISAETLKVVMRHSDFSTTERFYGATRAAQSAAHEIHEKLAEMASRNAKPQDGTIDSLTAEEVRKLKALLVG